MEYRSISNIIMSICFLIMAIGLGLYVWQGGRYYMTIIPGAILLAACVILKDPIDDWYFKTHPPRVDDNLINALKIEYPILNQYNGEQLETFNQRLAKFLLRKDAYLVTGETEKLDIFHSAMMCVPAVLMQKTISFDYFNHIQKLVAYKHPFPSPRMPFIHSVELDMEDGVAIISLEQLFNGLRNPNKYYSVVHHLWADHFYQHIGINEDVVPNDFKNNISRIFPYTLTGIQHVLGHKGTRDEVLALVAYWTFPDNLRKVYPELFSYFESIFCFYVANKPPYNQV